MATIHNFESENRVPTDRTTSRIRRMSSKIDTRSRTQLKGDMACYEYEWIYQYYWALFCLQPKIDLAESLISLGFARIKDSKKSNEIVAVLTRDEQLKKYYDKLDKIQADAKRNRRGLWASIVPPTPWPLSVIKSQISKFVYNKILPAKSRLPELVRWPH